MDKVRVYLYNDVGQFIGDRAFEINAIPKNATQVRPPDGLFSPTFDGEQWIEGKPQEEIDLIISEPKPITAIELLMQKIEKQEIAIQRNYELNLTALEVW